MSKVKLIVLNQVIDETYHVHNSDGGHLEGFSCIYSYVVADRQFIISYNEAAILSKYDCQWREGGKSYSDDNVGGLAFDYNPIRLNVDFNNSHEWKKYCERFCLEEHPWQGGGIYETGTEQEWNVSKESTIPLLKELSTCVPDKYELLEVNGVEDLKIDNQWRCYFFSLEIKKVYDSYLAESRDGCREIQERIWEKNKQIRELEEKIKTVKEDIEQEKINLIKQEQDNLIKLLCEKKLCHASTFPPTLGFDNISPKELALCSGNKQLFIQFYKEGLLEGTDDVLCLLLKFGLFDDYNREKKSFNIYIQYEKSFRRMHLFYAVYNMDYEELYRIADLYCNNKDFVRDFFTDYYEDKCYPYEFDMIIHRKEIQSLVLKDFLKDCEEWAKDVSYSDLSLFKLEIKDMNRILFEEFGEDKSNGTITIYYNVLHWFSERLSNK